MYRFGLVCTNAARTLTTNKTFRLSSLSKERLFETVQINIQGLIGLSYYCKETSIPLLRLGNAFIPFASHKDFDPLWWKELEPMLKEAKQKLPEGAPRLTIHPGQFIQLGSKHPHVIASSLEELAYCHRLLTLLGDDQSVITLHVGSSKEGMDLVFERFLKHLTQNTWLKDFLALENDEHNYSAHETLKLANSCSIPMIFDSFHHSILPSKILWSQIKQSWGKKRPKVHISSQGMGPVGAHADFIEREDFSALLSFLGNDAPHVDIVVEAKAKELAIERLWTII